MDEADLIRKRLKELENEDNNPEENEPTSPNIKEPEHPEIIPANLPEKPTIKPEPPAPEDEDDELDEWELRKKGFMKESDIEKIVAFRLQEEKEKLKPPEIKTEKVKCESCQHPVLKQEFEICPDCGWKKKTELELMKEQEVKRLKDEEKREASLAVARAIAIQESNNKKLKTQQFVYKQPEKPPEEPMKLIKRIEPLPTKWS